MIQLKPDQTFYDSFEKVIRKMIRQSLFRQDNFNTDKSIKTLKDDISDTGPLGVFTFFLKKSLHINFRRAKTEISSFFI